MKSRVRSALTCGSCALLLNGFGVIALAVATLNCDAQSDSGNGSFLPAGAVLRVQVDHRSRVKVGSRVYGHLTEPLYVRDHLVVPAEAKISGVVQSTHPAKKSVHVAMLVNGDFTPPRIPNVVFDQISVPAFADQPAKTLLIDAPSTDRNAAVVKLGVKSKKVSLIDQAKAAAKSQTDEARHTNKTEFIEKYVLNQLPYHPLMIWTKDGFDGTLSAPVRLSNEASVDIPLAPFPTTFPKGALHARLLTSLSSADAAKGQTFEAVVTEPLFADDGTSLLLPEGAQIEGTVVQVKAARKFGHNGTLRVTFSHLQLGAPGGSADVHGFLSSTEAAGKDHVSLDEEGQAKASDGPAKYAEPALLAVLTFASFPDRRDTSGTSGAGGVATAGSGGLIGRVTATVTDPAVAEALAALALSRSIYAHFIAKGHETAFPMNTRVEISLLER